ncbi:MAG: hypothetical protein BLM47_12105 [Candidatus Reconcilbacillus cellulovorans]|uniref:Chromate transporter n=1 Tax=Candidatus Reconcilbacillus cellulovorans TaxID=1906605 RepID=A0A2A6DXL8_9BACL|nr:MAG: hypothetical protein BLM47_12105 [Candidatus Reconcilbacillus cellulovorans]
MKKAQLRVKLFWSFFKVGWTAFGGGYAVIPFFEREIAERRRWMRRGELADLFGAAQSVPGAIAVNAAAMVGRRVAGWPGALTAALGVLTPAFGLALACGVLYFALRGYPQAEAVFRGVRAGAVALIVYAAVRFARTALQTTADAIVALAALFMLLAVGVHPAWVIAGGAAVGLAFGREAGLGGRRLDDLVRRRKEAQAPRDPGYFLGDGI